MENLTTQELKELMQMVSKDSLENPENEKRNDEIWNKLWEMKKEIL